MGIWRASCDDDSDNMNRWCAFMNNTGETNRPPHKLCVFLPWSLYILCRHNGICVRKWRFYSTLSHKTSFPCTRRYIWSSLSLLILSFLCTYIYIPQFYDLLGLRPTSGFLFLYIQTSAYWWKESRWSATTGHTQKKDFFFSLFFLFILNKKEIINTIKEIYIKKSHFLMVFKWCPLLRNFRHETCVVFSPLLLILYRMFFFLYFMFNGYETWIDTRWLFRRTELLYTNSFQPVIRARKKVECDMDFCFGSIHSQKYFSLSLFLRYVIQDWQLFSFRGSIDISCNVYIQLFLLLAWIYSRVWGSCQLIIDALSSLSMSCCIKSLSLISNNLPV